MEIEGWSTLQVFKKKLILKEEKSVRTITFKTT